MQVSGCFSNNIMSLFSFNVNNISLAVVNSGRERFSLKNIYLILEVGDKVGNRLLNAAILSKKGSLHLDRDGQ